MSSFEEWAARLDQVHKDLGELVPRDDRQRRIQTDSQKTVDELRIFLRQLARQPAQIDDFLASVGSGMRKAQEKLDAESAHYLQSRPDLAPQTTFRLPKLSAHLKLGMRQVEGKSLNFFVYQRESETTNYLEQEISFEIVASPPPPDAIDRIAELPLSRLLVTNQVDRARVLDSLKQATGGPALVSRPANIQKLRDILDKLKLDEDFRRVLLLDANDSWLLLYMPPDSVDWKEFEILALSRDLATVQYVSTPDSNLNLLKGLFKDLIDKQAGLLTQMGRTA